MRLHFAGRNGAPVDLQRRSGWASTPQLRVLLSLIFQKYRPIHVLEVHGSLSYSRHQSRRDFHPLSTCVLRCPFKICTSSASTTWRPPVGCLTSIASLHEDDAKSVEQRVLAGASSSVQVKVVGPHESVVSTLLSRSVSFSHA